MQHGEDKDVWYSIQTVAYSTYRSSTRERLRQQFLSSKQATSPLTRDECARPKKVYLRTPEGKKGPWDLEHTSTPNTI
jgi:hypothetical protein